MKVTIGILLLLCASLFGSTLHYSNSLAQLKATLVANNNFAEEERKRLKEEYENVVKDLKTKNEELIKNEKRKLEDINNISTDYDNLRLQFMELQTSDNCSGETSETEPKDDTINGDGRAERNWLVFRENVELIRYEAELINQAYASCRDLFKLSND